MGISRSTYYYRPKDNLLKKKHDADIADLIEKICYRCPYYGYRSVTAALRRKKMVVNHKKVLKMMKKMGIQCRKARRFAVYNYPPNCSYILPHFLSSFWG